MFDWTLAEGAPGGVRLILAGGLTPDNVGRGHPPASSPWGVDVVTGVEASPGRKDPVKLRAFVGPRPRAADDRRRTTSGRPHGRRPVRLGGRTGHDRLELGVSPEGLLIRGAWRAAW